MYEVYESSEKAKAIVYWHHRMPERPEFERLNNRTGFPFKTMKVGQSFFLNKGDPYPYRITEAKKYARLYTKKYNRYFVIVEHGDRIEFARLA